MKKRALRCIFALSLIVLLGLGYYAICKSVGAGIPCMFHKITGLYCPGCGISRMFISLLGGDIKGAADSNIAVLCSLPIFAVLIAYGLYKYVRYGDRTYSRWQKILLYILLAALICFGIARNVFPYEILVP